MTDEQFNECMAMLFSYYRKPVDGVLSKLYARRFINLNYIDFYNGVNNHIDDEQYKWFPDIPELRSFMPEVKQQMIQNKGSLTWCDNTQKLMDEYCPDEYKIKVGAK
jgi:hypothetical protein